MAKLGEANIGGRMVPAWLLDLTAEELDSLKWYSERYSNSNLLDNPWFTVNQRGVTSYTSNYSYGVDRWMSRLSGASISNGEIKIGHTNGIAQILEDVLIDYIIGKECTISAIVNGVLYSATRVLSGSYIYFNLGDSGIRMDLNLTATKMVMFYNSSGEDRTISAVKLELGSASTLANDSPPDYTTELLKCMTSKADSADTYANCEIAPKMELGVEYRTTERWGGVPVYVKLVNCGAIADGKTVAHGIENPNFIIRFEGIRAGKAMPQIHQKNLSDTWTAYVAAVDATIIVLTCGDSAAGTQCYVTLWYTKTTD